MRAGLIVIGVSLLAVLSGCSNPSYSSVGMGRGQTMMMPSEIPASNKLNEPVGRQNQSPAQGQPVQPTSPPGEALPQEGTDGGPEATGESQTPASPDRAQL